MTTRTTRRTFLADVARGAVVSSVGVGLAREFGWAARALADPPADALSFGALEPLVALLQETPADRLLPLLVERLRAGTELRTLVAAGALANARTFGGEDYVGFHTMMAIGPAWHMATEMPERRRALPVLKVLHRNTARIGEVGGRRREVLRPVTVAALPAERAAGDVLREAVRAQDVARAEGAFAGLARGPGAALLDVVLESVVDEAEVHRVALPWRAFELSSTIGDEHAHTLLRQSLRYCVKEEARGMRPTRVRLRAHLPRLFDEHRLAGLAPGVKSMDDAWVEAACRTILGSTPEDAAGFAARALAEGTRPDDLGEAISLAANQLLLRDTGRTATDARPGKPEGSVHGDSIGLHASDSASAWRNLARVASPRNSVACLLLGAWQVALDRVARGGDFLRWEPLPRADDVARVEPKDADSLLRAADEAILANDQRRASAIVARCGELGVPERRVFDLLLGHAASVDGALHAEKYYRTVVEEFRATRASFRWRHLVALARVSASAAGQRSAAYDEASRLLAV